MRPIDRNQPVGTQAPTMDSLPIPGISPGIKIIAAEPSDDAGL